jgi:hypothetical protein
LIEKYDQSHVVAVADPGVFRRAAERLNLTQSTVVGLASSHRGPFSGYLRFTQKLAANNRPSADRPLGPVPVSPFLRTIQLGSSRTLLLGFRVAEANRNGEPKFSSSIAGRSCVQSAAVVIGAATLELKCSQ